MLDMIKGWDWWQEAKYDQRLGPMANKEVKYEALGIANAGVFVKWKY